MTPGPDGLAVAVLALLAAAYVVAGTRETSTSWRTGACYAGAACFVALVALRMPSLFAFDRVWAESGSLYFKHAYEAGPASALVRQVSNYFDLSANVASALAVTLGLHAWPATDILLGLLPVLLLPLALAGLGFERREQLGILLAVAGALYSIHSGETFGTVLHAKGWGAIYTFLVLLSLGLGRPLEHLHRVLLVVLPLTGPTAALLLFAFAGAAVVLRPVASYAFLVWTVPGLAVQLLCLFGAGRGTGLDIRPISPLAAVYGADLFLERVLFGLVQPSAVVEPAPPRRVRLIVTSIGTAATLVAALWLFIRSPSRRDTILLYPVIVGHFVATAALAVGGAGAVAASGGGMRYFFPTLCMLGALLVTTGWHVRRWFPAAVAAAVIGVALVARPAIRETDPYFTEAHHPPWRVQIEADADAPVRTLRTYPSDWSFTLPRCGEHWCGRGSPRP